METVSCAQMVGSGRWRLWATLALLGGALHWWHLGPLKELCISSSPAGATAFLDNHPCGTTPCRIWVRSRGELRLEHSGYLPVHEFLRLNGKDGQELHVRMRPGVIVGSWSAPAGFYPPSLGKPPVTFFLAKDNQLGGHAYAIPPGWHGLSPSLGQNRLALACGDGHTAPVRQASLEILSQRGLEERCRQVQEGKEQVGWTVVASQRGSQGAWIRLERAHDLGLSRAAVVLQRVGSGVLQLDYQFDDCQDPFTYTRDLDYLRASLGFHW